jgi:O-antigen ligase
MGLLCLPALRLADEDRPAMIVLMGALVWAAASTTWSPSHPGKPEQSVILQLALALPLYWSALCGARAADPRLNALAMRVLSVGLAIFGLVLVIEIVGDTTIYRWLHLRFAGPIRTDIAENKLGHASSVLALLWPAAVAGSMRQRWEVALLVVVVAATVVAGNFFRADAPLVALPVCSAAMLLVWLWPRIGPRILAAGLAAGWLVMPLLIWGVRESGRYGIFEHEVPPSWAARMSYWSYAVDRIAQRPFEGWGLDASRTFGPNIGLHPHNTALQVWLELGLPGAVAAATLWGLSTVRLSRRQPELEMAGVAGSVAAYLLFSWLTYGLWQQWWVALGVYLSLIAAMLSSSGATPKST